MQGPETFLHTPVPDNKLITTEVNDILKTLEKIPEFEFLKEEEVKLKNSNGFYATAIHCNGKIYELDVFSHGKKIDFELKRYTKTEEDERGTKEASLSLSTYTRTHKALLRNGDEKFLDYAALNNMQKVFPELIKN